MEGRPQDLSRTDDARVPELLHHHRPGEPFGAVEHGRVDRAARRLVSALPRPHARRSARRRRADGDGGGGLGAARERLAPTSRSFRAPIPGTWAPTFPGSRASSCRTSAASIATGRPATRSSAATTSASPSTARVVRAAHDGVVNRLQLDVAILLELVARPRCRRSRPCRSTWRARPPSRWQADRPPGPAVGEVVDGELPGAAGTLRVPPLPSRHAGAASHRRLLPRRRLGAGQPRLRRSRSAATSACQADAIVVSVELSPCPGGALPGGRRRRVRRRPLDRGQRRGAGRSAGTARGVRLERRRQHRRRRLPDGARCRRPAHRRPGAGDSGDRLRSHAAVVRRERRRLSAHDSA